MNAKINNGGPAFPHVLRNDADSAEAGMTLRDYFAAKAMAGMLADPAVRVGDSRTRILAELSYEIADAMIAARGAA